MWLCWVDILHLPDTSSSAGAPGIVHSTIMGICWDAPRHHTQSAQLLMGNPTREPHQAPASPVFTSDQISFRISSSPFHSYANFGVQASLWTLPGVQTGFICHPETHAFLSLPGGILATLLSKIRGFFFSFLDVKMLLCWLRITSCI